MLLSKNPVKFFIGSLWYLFAIVTVLAAAGFGAARLLLPTANQYTEEIEQQVVELIGQPLNITSLDAEWRGFTPMLVLKDVEVYRKDKSKVIMRFPTIRIGFDIFGSLFNQTITISRFDLIGANLFLTRNTEGDIEITGLEIDGASDSDLDSTLLKDLLLGQERLSLELHNLIFTDKYKKQKIYHLSNITLLMRSEDDRHIIDGTVNFAGQKNKELVVSIDSRGDILDIKNWTGELYSSGKSLNISDLVGLEEMLGQRVQFGNFNHEIWIDIKKSKITKIQANVSTHNVSFTPEPIANEKPHPLNYETLSGEFLWQHKDPGWVFNAREFVIKKPFGYWPKSSLAVAYHDTEEPSIQVNMDYLRVDDLVEIAAAYDKKDDSILSRIVNAHPTGIVRDLYFSSSVGEHKDFQGFAKIENFGAVDEKKLLTVSGLSGKLNINNQVGSLDIDSNHLQLDVPTIFNNPLELGSVDADLAWIISERDIDVKLDKISVLNSDVSLTGRVAMKWPINAEPATIDMTSDIKWARGDRVYSYLPHKVLSSGTNAWLKSAFKAAVVSRGTAVLKGPLREFPYKNGKGEFVLKFHVANGVLDYADKWPKIRDISADVLFDSTRMLVKSDKAMMLSSTLNGVSVELPDMSATPVRLNIAGHVKGDTQHKFNYLLASPPLKELYGAFLTKVNARGYSDLNLNLKLDLDDDIKSTVSGTVDLRDNELDFQDFGNVLTKTTGRIDFSGQDIKAKGIKAKLIGQEATINISTESMLGKGPRDDSILVHAKSEILASEISKRYLPVMQDLWTGKSPLDLKIKIPLNRHDRNMRSDKGVDIVLDSFLQGIEVRLPKPYDKTVEEKLHLTSTITLAENDRVRYRTRYGGHFDSLIEYNNSSTVDVSGGRVRGEVRFGSGVAVLPTTSGVRLVGELDELKIDIWKSLLDQFEIKSSSSVASDKLALAQTSAAKSANDLKLVHSADVTVKKFSAWGQRAEDLHLVVSNVSEGLYAVLDSRAIKGRVEIPKDTDTNPIKMDFDYIHLSANDDDVGGGEVDPRDFPSILARSKSVTFKDKKFGSVELAVTKLTEGIRIEKLYVQPKATKISAHGSWLLVKGKPESTFEFYLESTDLGATMVDLGYKDSIKNGVGKVDVKLKWPGGLTAFQVDQLAGEVHFSLEDGQLLDYDPLGKASILGLFSIQTLPRRLFLDFSDLVDKGLTFDSITGDVSIEDGDAYTTNFKMQGPVVGATLAGRTGLAAQDYDQRVKVDLRVSDIISFVGLLLASPWAVILPQLLKDEFNSASTLEYSLTGSWDDPKLEPIVALEEPEEDELGQE